MARLAAESVPGLEVSDIEHQRSGPSFTADTVKVLMAKYPNAKLFFIIGSDSVPQLHTWKRIGELKRNVTFAVASRGGRSLKADLAANRAGVDIAQIPIAEPHEVSSTKIRALATSGKPIEDVPPAVVDYIRAHGLYGASGVVRAEGVGMGLYDRIVLSEAKKKRTYVAALPDGRKETIKSSREIKFVTATKLNDRHPPYSDSEYERKRYESDMKQGWELFGPQSKSRAAVEKAMRSQLYRHWFTKVYNTWEILPVEEVG